MGDSRQTWHDTERLASARLDDEADDILFAVRSEQFTDQQLVDDGNFDRPRRPEDALAEIESLERLIAEAGNDVDLLRESTHRPTSPLVVRSIETPCRIEVAPCIVCHGTTATSRFAIAGLPEELVVCDTCGLGSLFPLPNEQRLSELRTALELIAERSVVDFARSPTEQPVVDFARSPTGRSAVDLARSLASVTDPGISANSHPKDHSQTLLRNPLQSILTIPGLSAPRRRALASWCSEVTARLRTHWQLRSIPSGSRVLQLSCADGGVPVASSLLSGSRFEAFSVQFASGGEMGAEHCPQVLAVHDLPDAAFDSRSFEAVVLRGVLERHPQPQRLLDEIRRVLKPGGILIATLPNFASWQAGACGPDWRHLNLPRNLHHFTPESLRRLLQRAEFDSVSIQHSTFANVLPQLPLGNWALTCLQDAAGSGEGLLRSLIRRGGTMSVTARLSRLQPVDAIQRSALPSSLVGAFS